MDTRKPNKKKVRTGDLVFYICIAAVPFLQFCIFYVGVNFNSILLAFQRYDNLTGELSFARFDNFSVIFNELITRPWQTRIQNSLILYLCTLLVGISISLIFSYYIYKKKLGSKIFKIILFIPSVISIVVIVTMFRFFVDDCIPAIFKAMGISIEGLLSSLDTRMQTLIIFTLLTSLGIPILTYVGAMSGIDESIIEAGKIDGAGAIRELLSIVLPQIYRTISVFVVSGLAGMFVHQMNLYSFYGSFAQPKFQTVGYYLFAEVKEANTYAPFPKLAALGILITLVTAPVTLLIRKLLNKFDPNN